MADPKASKGRQELSRKSMKTTKGGGIKVPQFNPQPEPPGAELPGRTSQVIGPEI